MPLALDLSGGLCVTVSPGTEQASAGASREWINGVVRNLLLRALMAFPPAKLEAVMIDPRAQGRSFDGFSSLVDKKHEAVIDGQIWTREEEITKAISTLNSKLATASKQYGSDKTGYFRRESLRVLAINDFPQGFTEQSISNLATIVASARAFGVTIFIGVDPTYVGPFANNADYRSILTNPQVVRLSGNSPDALSVNDTAVWISLDKQLESDLAKHRTDIIATLRQGISRSQGRIEPFSQLFENIDDPSSWCREDALDGIQFPIGVIGAGAHETITIGRGGGAVEHHGLIAGTTGAGKSTLLHTMIMSILLSYPPTRCSWSSSTSRKASSSDSTHATSCPASTASPSTLSPSLPSPHSRGAEALRRAGTHNVRYSRVPRQHRHSGSHHHRAVR